MCSLKGLQMNLPTPNDAFNCSVDDCRSYRTFSFEDEAVLVDKDGELLGHTLQQQNHTKLN